MRYANWFKASSNCFSRFDFFIALNCVLSFKLMLKIFRYLCANVWFPIKIAKQKAKYIRYNIHPFR